MAIECKNSTENTNICKSQEDIDKHLNNAYWALYFTD